MQCAARVFVFKEITNSLFEWYRPATPEEVQEHGQHILVEDLLSYDELMLRLNED